MGSQAQESLITLLSDRLSSLNLLQERAYYIMEGYTQREMAEQYDWSSRYATKLRKLLRTTFYEALTGEKPPPRSTKPTKKELATLQRLAALRD